LNLNLLLYALTLWYLSLLT